MSRSGSIASRSPSWQLDQSLSDSVATCQVTVTVRFTTVTMPLITFRQWPGVIPQYLKL